MDSDLCRLLAMCQADSRYNERDLHERMKHLDDALERRRKCELHDAVYYEDTMSTLSSMSSSAVSSGRTSPSSLHSGGASSHASAVSSGVSSARSMRLLSGSPRAASPRRSASARYGASARYSARALDIASARGSASAWGSACARRDEMHAMTERWRAEEGAEEEARPSSHRPLQCSPLPSPLPSPPGSEIYSEIASDTSSHCGLGCLGAECVCVRCTRPLSAMPSAKSSPWSPDPRAFGGLRPVSPSVEARLNRLIWKDATGTLQSPTIRTRIP